VDAMNLHGVILLLGLIASGLVLIALSTTRRIGWIVETTGLAALAWFAYRDFSFQGAFNSAQLGDRRTAIVERIGQPTTVTAANADPDGGTFGEAGCDTNLWYNSFFLVERHQYCYSADDVLIYKYRWSSW
jgi:hypothetical protein